jgi:creatinine amidohydrolase/Fe(II)-dependent formamide hydrolase-like protein
VLEGAARSFRRAGFRDIVLIGDHGGYQSDLAAVAAKLNREWAATPVRVHFIAEYYKAATEPFAAALRQRGLSEAQIGTHAGSADTSLMLASTRAWCAPTGWRKPPSRPTAPTATRGLDRRPRPGRRRPDRRRQRQRDPQGRRSIIDGSFAISERLSACTR